MCYLKGYLTAGVKLAPKINVVTNVEDNWRVNNPESTFTDVIVHLF